MIFNITLKYEGKFYDKRKKLWKIRAYIQFYAPLLLPDMKWEVAYSTLCTDFFFFFRKLYINLHMAGLHFHKLDLWQHSHTKHTNTQAYVNQIWEDFMTAAIFNRVTGPTGFRKQGFSQIFVAREDT